MDRIKEKIFTLNPRLGFYASFQKANSKLQLSVQSFCIPDEYDVAVVFGLEFIKSFQTKQEVIVVEDDLQKALALLESEHLQEFEKEKAHFLFLDNEAVCNRLAMYLASKKVYFSPAFGNLERLNVIQQLEANILPLRMLASEIVDFGASTLKNCIQNLKQIDTVYPIEQLKGKAAATPAVIIGAGPSLEASVADLTQLYEKALFFSGGSAIASLAKRKIPLDYLIAVDPFSHHLKRAKYFNNYPVPCFFSPRTQPDVFSSLLGKKIYLPHVFGFPFLHDFEMKFQLQCGDFPEDRGWSLICQLVATAHYMKCDPIYLVGVDLSYTGDKAFADDFFEEKTNGLETKEIWIEEGRWLSEYAQKSGVNIVRIGSKNSLPAIANGTFDKIKKSKKVKKPNLTSATTLDVSHELEELKKEFQALQQLDFSNKLNVCFNLYYRQILEPLYAQFSVFFNSFKEVILGEENEKIWQRFMLEAIRCHEEVFFDKQAR